VLDADVYHNDQQSIEGNGNIGALKRLAKPIDRVVNTYLKQWLGAFC
jgi:hypothetical protein